MQLLLWKLQTSTLWHLQRDVLYEFTRCSTSRTPCSENRWPSAHAVVMSHQTGWASTISNGWKGTRCVVNDYAKLCHKPEFIALKEASKPDTWSSVQCAPANRKGGFDTSTTPIIESAIPRSAGHPTVSPLTNQASRTTMAGWEKNIVTWRLNYVSLHGICR